MEFHSEVRHAAMLDSILQSFLKNPEEAKRNFFGNVVRDTLLTEINRDVVHLRKLGAETTDCGFEADVVEIRRVQVVGDGSNALQYL